jgi:hypothetical protein
MLRGGMTAVLLLALLAGCQGLTHHSSTPDVAPEPVTQAANAPPAGMLLQTGALRLGPGVGRDLPRAQGDGGWGF